MTLGIGSDTKGLLERGVKALERLATAQEQTNAILSVAHNVEIVDTEEK